MIADAPMQFVSPLTPHPKQRLALWLIGLDPEHPLPPGGPVNELLYGGAGGGGKSALARMIITIASQRWPGWKTAVFRKAGPDLWETQITPLLQELPERIGGFNRHHMKYTFANGSTVEYHHCFTDEDHLRFKSFEFDMIIFEEATELPEHQITYIRSRCRSPKPGWHPLVIYLTNPGGPSHLYFKRNFVDTRESGVPFWGPWEATEAGLTLIGGEDFRYRRCFLKARLEDNPSLTPAMALAGMAAISDPELRAAVAEGRWDLHAGQFFSDFRDAVHICDGFRIPDDWYVWRSIDWGSSAPTACLWLARDPALARKHTYCYRYWQQAGLPDQECARIIRGLSYDDPRSRLTLADPSMFNKTTGAQGQTHAQEYAAAGLPLTKANNRRPIGWARIRQALQWGKDYGPPELQIFKHTDTTGTGELIREIANIEYAKDDWEDIKEPTNLTDLRDEALDCLRMGLQGAAAVSRRRPTQIQTYRLGAR